MAGHMALSGHPNPFREGTNIGFSLAKPSAVTLEIYDLAGRKVRSLESGDLRAGDHLIRWDGRNEAGRRVASGVYFARLQSSFGVESKSLNIIR
jgi:flagellar hook assembly protein FlgD